MSDQEQKQDRDQENDANGSEKELLSEDLEKVSGGAAKVSKVDALTIKQT